MGGPADYCLAVPVSMRQWRAVTIARIILNCADPPALARFFADAFGFVLTTTSKDGSIRLLIGKTSIELARSIGRPMPPNVQGWSPLFQHFAIVTRDMEQAFQRLQNIQGWSSISTAGPQRLPDNAGGVTAFKFRSPEGHPLELLAFPEGRVPVRWRDPAPADKCLGIDHSAISVASTTRSLAFYEEMGLRRSGSSRNHGREQDRLDGLKDVDVEVTALAFEGGEPPHLELLAYQGSYDRDGVRPDYDDTAATRLVFASREANARRLWRDPDGHILQIEPLTPSDR